MISLGNDREKTTFSLQQFQKETLVFGAKFHDSKFSQNFENRTPLGKGGFGKVFKAKPIDDDVYYAVKWVKLSLHNQEEKCKVLRESEALSKLKHSNIVKLIDTWTENLPLNFAEMMQSSDEDCSLSSASSSSQDSVKFIDDDNGIDSMCGIFMQMELCDMTITDWLEQNPDRTKKMYHDIFCQVVKAIDFIHESKFVHRDIKPSNIFLLNNVVKVGDFGLVKSLQCSSANQYLSTESLNTNELDLYMAPELKLGTSCKLTNKVDIFPLGLILLEMIHCCKTYHEKFTLFRKARNYNFSQSLQINYPDQLELIISLLKSEPESRPTAKEILISKALL